MGLRIFMSNIRATRPFLILKGTSHVVISSHERLLSLYENG